MSSLTRLQGRFGQRILKLTTATVLLTGLLRRDSHTARARRLQARRDDVAVVMVDQDHRLGGDEFTVVVQAPAACLEQRLAQPVRMLHTPVVLEDGRTVGVAASVRAAATGVLGTRDLTALQRAADAVLYDGKHSGHAVLAARQHITVPSINGRRAGRPGTSVWGRAA
ncbi:diguanylate cyclase domain-containing protein [Streptomyces sp. NPDC003860]